MHQRQRNGEDLSELTTIKSEGKATSTTAQAIGYQNTEVDELYIAQQKKDPKTEGNHV